MDISDPECAAMPTQPETHELTVHPDFRSFIEQELLPLITVSPADFWPGAERIFRDFGDENRRLLEVRDTLQQQIDRYHETHRAEEWDPRTYRSFLEEIGYLQPDPKPFRIDTDHVDDEIAKIAGPQLVVPVSNARFALNAANARWGSLFDALYGSDVIDRSGPLAPGEAYNEARGAAVITWACAFLDRTFPLDRGAHRMVASYEWSDKHPEHGLRVRLQDGQLVGLENPAQFKAYRVQGEARAVLLCHHGLHVELQIDRDHPVGRVAPGGIKDVVLESALTTIQDCEDSVAAVDVQDKVKVYRNWLGLMTGLLEVQLFKGDQSITRSLNPDRSYQTPDGDTLTLPGRSLMLVRNVGHLMTSDAVVLDEDTPVFEGLMDAIVTVGCALVDIRGLGRFQNSRTGSVYVVKPKMHGPDEVAFTDRLFAAVEDLYGLPRYTVKLGVMDEERRTTVNLAACIEAARHRLVFINTGFLDRTGDEIHTCMKAGAVLPKERIKTQPWIAAYEDWNVDIGIRCGLPGKAQIGKGMWPKPDEMREMMDAKSGHPEAGASCAWVPSPTAATLHAVHYHDIDVVACQRAFSERPLASLDDILSPPFCDSNELDEAGIQAELDNNAQGILGYVVRWIDQGVGCSKVPDVSDVGLMEDRATLRISSQHIANWLAHGVCSEAQVIDTFKRMAAVVDLQNADDPNYRPMASDFDNNLAFRAACDLALKGEDQPNGYTEPLLHAYRRQFKESVSA